MKPAIFVLMAVLTCTQCSTYERGEDCLPEVCDGKDTDCDGFIDETRHECADGKLVEWCKCDTAANFECSQDPGRLCRDSNCDDGTDPLCLMEPPVCVAPEILAHQNYCYLCVDPETCQPAACEPGTVRTHECPDGSLVEWCNCNRSGVWDCVGDPASLCRDTRCDDGSEPMCDMIPPECQEWEILAYQNNCYLCVNPQTCLPWGTPECDHDGECPVTEYCDACGSSSCPGCEDCVAACRPHDCETEDEPLCNMMRPECEHNQTAVVREGCWVCVSLDTCESETCQDGQERSLICEDGQEVFWCRCEAGAWQCIDSPESQCRDTSCDDGTEPVCLMEPPECDDEWEILAYQDNCYICVNPYTCKPWGEPGCEDDLGCAPDQFCDPCGTSSCPMCDDCLAACRPHGCPSEMDLMCYCARPECSEGISVIYDGCWICVYWDTCTPTGEGC